MTLVPRAERGGINLNDGVLDQSVGSNQFVVTGIVDYADDSGLSGGGF